MEVAKTVQRSSAPAVAEDPVLFAVPSITEDDVAAVTAVLRSGWITTGNESQQLEAELAEYLGASHVIAVSSCTAALEISSLTSACQRVPGSGFRRGRSSLRPWPRCTTTCTRC